MCTTSIEHSSHAWVVLTPHGKKGNAASHASLSVGLRESQVRPAMAVVHTAPQATWQICTNSKGANSQPQWQLSTPHRKHIGIIQWSALRNRMPEGQMSSQNNIAHAIEACAEKKNHREQSSLWLIGI